MTMFDEVLFRDFGVYLRWHFGAGPMQKPEEDRRDYYVRWIEHNLKLLSSSHRLEHLRDFIRIAQRRTRDCPDTVPLTKWHEVSLACRFRLPDGTMFVERLKEIAKTLPDPANPTSGKRGQPKDYQAMQPIVEAEADRLRRAEPHLFGEERNAEEVARRLERFIGDDERFMDKQMPSRSTLKRWAGLKD